ncbi:MAG: leucine-rich repeat domain-containing protein, partial [Eubacterium sp.]|nr:leucine-rich repeat domain-containing protein [Eubacterium sp.]
FSHTSIKSIVLPEGITVIDDEAFAGCYELESITLGEKTTEIGKKAFYDCTSLKEITIPKTVTKIGEGALEHADNLMKVDNKSAQTCPLPTKRLGAYPLWQTFFVDGNKTTEVPAGKVVLGKWNSYKVTLKLSGGKLVGKRISKHTYNSSEKLPKVKKKGYVFCGWKLKSSSLGITVETIRKTISKPTVYKAIFKKVTKKKTGKKTTITLKNPKIEGCNSNLHIKVFSNKKASKNATTFVLNLDKKKIAKKAGIVCKYLPKKNKVEIKGNNKNAKKVKVYWGDDGDTESELFSKEYSIIG